MIISRLNIDRIIHNKDCSFPHLKPQNKNIKPYMCGIMLFNIDK